MKKLKLIFASAPDFSGNVKAIYEYINKNYKHLYELYLIISDEEFAKKNGSKFNYCMLNECESLVQSSDVVFDTHGILLDYVTEKQIYVNLWHGQGPKKSGFLFDYNNMAPGDIDYCNKMSQKIDINTVTSEFWRVLFSSMWNINANKIILTGQPRNDILMNSDGKVNLTKLLNVDVNKYKKIIIYLPTFRKGINRVDSNINNMKNILFLKKYNEKKLIKYLEENNYLLVIKSHPSEEINLPQVKSRHIFYLNDKEMNDKCISLYDILNAADLMLSDYSSVYVDFLILNRPILFLNCDKVDYINNRGVIFDNMDFWCPGPQIKELKDLLWCITKSFHDNKFYKAERDNFIQLMYKYTDNNSSKRLYEYIFSDGKINEEIYKENLVQSKTIEKTFLKKIKNILKVRKGDDINE